MRRWPLLGNRDYMLLWSGETLSELGSQMSTVAYPLLVLALTGSAERAGVVGLARWLPLAVAALPAGMIADHVDRRRAMIAADVIRLLGAASITVMLLLGRPPFGQIVVVAFLDGILFTLSYTCERSALPQVVSPAYTQDAVAQNEARMFAAGIVGPPLGGVLFGAARALPFLADAVSFLASTTALALTRVPFQPPRAATTQPAESLRSRIGGGLAWIWSHRFFRTTMLVFAAGNPLFTGLSLLAILLARAGGASPAAIGVMLALIGAAGVLGAVLAGPLRRRLGPRLLLVGEGWLMVAAVAALFAARNPVLIGVLLGAAEFLTPVTNSVVAGSRAVVAPGHLQGRVQAASTLMSMSLAWLGPLAVGVLYARAGATATVAVLAGWAGLLAVVVSVAPGVREGPPVVPLTVSPLSNVVN